MAGPGNATFRAERAAWPEEAVSAPEQVAHPVAVEDELAAEEREVRKARMQQFVQAAVLAGYAVLVAVGIAWHEPWADEAQAWLLARDQGFWHLMLHSLRYEGSPGLWHALLWVLARAHVSYLGMRWISGVIALAGVYVLLRWSPFPLILKILLPFGFWLAYQDAVVARSYVLFAVLAFPAAAILRAMARDDGPVRRSTVIWLAVVLGLMANLSIHGFIASIGFWIVTLAVLRRKAKAGMLLRKTVPAAIIGCAWIFVVVTVFPPSDVNFPAGKNLQMSTQKIWAALGSQTAKAELQDEKERGLTPRPGELAMQAERPFQKTAAEARWHKIGRILGLLTFPVSNFRYLALVACVLVIAQGIVFRPARGQVGWVGLLPWALMILLFTSMYLAPRHAGMIWEAMIAALWLTWPAEPVSGGFALWMRRVTVAALVLVALNQVQWTGRAMWEEIHKPYAGDKAMAQWLKANETGRRIAGFGYHSVGVTAWFDHPVYFNQPATYWIWSQQPRNDARAPFAIATHPDVIVYGGWNWSEHNADISEDWVKPNLAELNSVPLNDAFHIVDYAEAHGYRETHRFCGHAFLRSGYSEELCQVALEPAQ
ncbi:MAG: hypothetical protein WA476_00435 [Acidobacteriaceae bacterium]